MAFDGFTKDTLAVLRGLERNNDKVWFDANRSRYQESVLGLEKEFVSAMGEHFQMFAPGIQAIPRVNGSIFRINRDTRFSKDKTPYKTNADIWFWEGEDRKAASGFFLRIVPKAIWVGAGAHMLSPEGIEALRVAVAEEESGSELVDIVADLEADGYDVGEQRFKRVPRDYPKDHPRAELLKFGSLYCHKVLPVPSEFYGPDFTDWCASYYMRTQPLHIWLMAALRG